MNKSIKRNKWVRNIKNICRVLNCIEHLLLLISTVSGWVSIFCFFASLIGIPVGIMRFAIRLKNYVITAGVKNYKTKIKKRK